MAVVLFLLCEMPNRQPADDNPFSPDSFLDKHLPSRQPCGSLSISTDHSGDAYVMYSGADLALPASGMRLANDIWQQSHFSPIYHYRRRIMAWDLLLTSDIGLFSLFTIAFMIVMAIYIARYALKHAKEEEKLHIGAKHAPSVH